jgi:hypothetical protein
MFWIAVHHRRLGVGGIMKKLLVVLSIILSACGGPSSSPSVRAPGQPNGTTATYKIGGTACNVSLTYTNEGGQTEQIAIAPISWTKSFVTHSGDHLYVSAQNNCNTGSVTCEIDLNGSPTSATSKSSGAYVIAACSGRVP